MGAPVEPVPHNNHADVNGRRMPDFMGVGAQKAGTTWLWENLRLHPDVYLPRRKELHFLDRHWDEGYEWYLRHFVERRVKGRLAGEITPNYLVTGLDRIETMHHINPDMKILVLVREPVDRAWSAARYFAQNRRGVPIESLSMKQFEAFVSTRFIGERGDYRLGISRWESVFGPEQLYVEFYDNILADPVGTFCRFARFLDIADDIDPADFELGTVFNPGPRAEIPDGHRRFLEDQLAPQTAWLSERYGDRGVAWLHGGPGATSAVTG